MRPLTKRALELAERQEARREGKVDLYLTESVSWRLHDGTRVLGFHIQAANATDRPNSVVSAELHLTYDVGGVLTAMKVGHLAGMPRPEIAIVPLTLPLSLPANEVANGWLLFAVTSSLTDDREIQRHDIAIRDIHGIEESRQVTIFRE